MAGLGVREGAFVLFLGPLGVAVERVDTEGLGAAQPASKTVAFDYFRLTAADTDKTHGEATPTPDAKPTSTETGTSPAGTAAEGTAKDGKNHSDNDVKVPPTPAETGTSPNGSAAENDGAAETPPAGEHPKGH